MLLLGVGLAQTVVPATGPMWRQYYAKGQSSNQCQGLLQGLTLHLVRAYANPGEPT
jgi:hypothetical protein